MLSRGRLKEQVTTLRDQPADAPGPVFIKALLSIYAISAVLHGEPRTALYMVYYFLALPTMSRRALALTGTVQVSRYRKHCDFGC